MKDYLQQAARRQPDALLAGVCAGIARALGWNVWVLRALFIGFLALKTLWAIGVYAVLAVVFNLADSRKRDDGSLDSPELADRNRRIEELERQFRDLERK